MLQTRVATLTSVIGVLDGLFHIFGNAAIFRRFSPDWLIAGRIAGQGGLPEYAHTIMGVFLVISSLYILHAYHIKGETIAKQDCYVRVFQRVFAPFTLLIIFIGVLIKLSSASW